MTFTEMLSAALARVIAFLPNLLAALLILVVGLLIASVLARLTHRALTRIEPARRRIMRKVVDDEAMLTRLPRAAGRLAYWSLALITLGLAVDALQLTWLSAGVARVLEYVPNVLAAAAIVIGAYLLGNYLYRRTRRAEAELGGQPVPRFWPELLRASLYVIAGFMALQELGIATTIVTSAFVIGLGALAIATAVAFGLGNRELAGRITRDWYERRKRALPETREIVTGTPPSALPQY